MPFTPRNLVWDPVTECWVAAGLLRGVKKRVCRWARPVRFLFWYRFGRPNGVAPPSTRKLRKLAKLKARGTYRPRYQWRLDRSRRAEVDAAALLAPQLNLTADELLAHVGYTR